MDDRRMPSNAAWAITLAVVVLSATAFLVGLLIALLS